LLKKADIVTLCIFRSTPAMMKRVVDGTSEDTHTLSDRKGSVYNKFQVKRTFKAVITGTMEVAPSTVKKSGKYKAYINYGRIMKDTKGVDGARAALQLPADFLIDENGIIVDLLRATKPQDYMEFERIEAFIPKDKRCRCNKKDCVSPTCRKTYEQIKKDAESMLFVG
jgi:peroxiredoxin